MNIKYFSILISMFFISGALSAAVSPALLGSDTREPVQFLVDGKLYDGYLGIDASNCLRAEVTAGDGDSVLVDDMQERLRGYLIPAHQDVGLDVYMLGDRDEVAFRYGVIEEVYDNGYHKIESTPKPTTTVRPFIFSSLTTSLFTKLFCCKMAVLVSSNSRTKDDNFIEKGRSCLPFLFC